MLCLCVCVVSVLLFLRLYLFRMFRIGIDGFCAETKENDGVHLTSDFDVAVGCIYKC